MSTNTKVKGRGFVKRIRDGVKTNYDRGSICEICGADEGLELHHFYSVSAMAEVWLKKNKIKIVTDEDSMLHRDTFIEEHWDKLVNQCATLCDKHHLNLHKLYGSRPLLSTGPKQGRWIKKQKDKHELV